MSLAAATAGSAAEVAAAPDPASGAAAVSGEIDGDDDLIATAYSGRPATGSWRRAADKQHWPVMGPWMAEEDAAILQSLQQGANKWSEVAVHVPGRVGPQCRERYLNHLDPRRLDACAHVKAYLVELVCLDGGGAVAEALAPPAGVGEGKIDVFVKEQLPPPSPALRAFICTNQLGKGHAVLLQQERVQHSAASLASVVALGAALQALCPGSAPQQLHYDSVARVLVTERLSPHASVRAEALSGSLYPLLANDASSVLARLAFGSGSWGSEAPSAAAAAARAALVVGSDTTAAALVQQLTDSPVARAAAAGSSAAAAALARLRGRLLALRQCVAHGALTTDCLVAAVLRPQPARVTFDALRGEDEPSEPAPAAVGDLRVLGGASALLAPAGLDVGTLMAHLLLALFAARARVRVQEALVARGGYARFSSLAARDRWAAHSAALAEVLTDLWAAYTARVVSLWDAALGAEHEHAHADGADCCAAATEAAQAPGQEPQPVHATDPTHASSVLVGGGFWRLQVRELCDVLHDALAVAACELLRCCAEAGSGGAVAGPDMLGLEPATARAGATARAAAFAAYLLASSAELSDGTKRRALRGDGRAAALRVLACGLDAAVSAAAAIDGEPGWGAHDRRPFAATLLLAAAPGLDLRAAVVATDAAWGALPATFDLRKVMLLRPPLAAASTSGPLAGMRAAAREAWGPVLLALSDGDDSGVPVALFSAALMRAAAGAASVLVDSTSGAVQLLALPPHAVLLSEGEGEGEGALLAGLGDARVPAQVHALAAVAELQARGLDVAVVVLP